MQTISKLSHEEVKKAVIQYISRMYPDVKIKGDVSFECDEEPKVVATQSRVRVSAVFEQDIHPVTHTQDVFSEAVRAIGNIQSSPKR